MRTLDFGACVRRLVATGAPSKLVEAAIHESGHAVLAHKLGALVRSATIVTNNASLGRVIYHTLSLTLAEHLSVLLAGKLAVEILANRSLFLDGGDSSDQKQIDELLNGKSRGILVTVRAETESLVRRFASDILRVAEALLKHDTLKDGFLWDLIEGKT